MDLAILTLRIGGPRLLHAFSVSNYLPESSVVYKALRESISINTSFESSLNTIICKNMNEFFTNRDGFFSIKMDEIALKPEIRYCNVDNEFKGTCHNHKHMLNNYSFNNWIDLTQIKDALVSGDIHIANESLMISISQVSSDDLTPKPIIIVPICSHESYGLLEEAIPNIIQSFKTLNKNAILLNIATDGDHARRKTLNQMKKLNHSLPVLKLLKNFDRNLVCGEYSVNYDPKHLAKRIRSIMISSSRTMLLNKVQINSNQVEALLKSKNISQTSNLLNPHDKQNVPMAVSLLEMIHQLTKEDFYEDNSNKNNPLNKDIYNELKLLGIITSLFLSLFTKLDINLIDQLMNMSYLSHLLLFIFRRHKTKFLTNNLYCDLQSTINDAFVVAAKYQDKGK